MTALFIALLATLRTTVRSRLELTAEILALRHQLAVLQRTTPKRPRLRPIDRLLWMLLSSVWPNWRQAVQIVTPATVPTEFLVGTGLSIGADASRAHARLDLTKTARARRVCGTPEALHGSVVDIASVFRECGGNLTSRR